MNISAMNSIPVIISRNMVTNNLVPKRRHHNKRIKKKWAKRFGYTFEYDDNIMFIDNKIYVSPRGYKKLLKIRDLNIW